MASIGAATPLWFAVYISGTQVNQDIDTDHQQFYMTLGNTDTVGNTQFSLQNTYGKYAQLTVSGNATIQVDAMSYLSGFVRTMFRGTIERTENDLSYNRGNATRVFAYDYGQELLGLLSPDARLPSALTASGTASILPQSGDQGMGASQGQDLVLFVSGSNYGSGATVANFMSQFIGTIADHTGSASGQLFTFKPYFSGMITSGPNSTYRTWYIPDSGAVSTSGDLNQFYWMPLDALKVKRQYAWDVLKKMTRQQVAIDQTGNKVQFELYVGVSGDVHIFTSGSNEFFASGVVFQYYAAGASGASLNNIVLANIPFDTTILKNKVVGWFPTWVNYPLDGDSWSDLMAYSGGFWAVSGVLGMNGLPPWPAGIFGLSGGNPDPGGGFISIEASNLASGTYVGAAYMTQLKFTYFSGLTLNAAKFNLSGAGPVSLAFAAMMTILNSGNQLGTSVNSAQVNMVITDSGGNSIIISGSTGSNTLVALTTGAIGFVANSGVNSGYSDASWVNLSVPLFNSGAFYGGDGRTTGWAGSGDLTRIKSIAFSLLTSLTTQVSGIMWNIDHLALTFQDQFSPIEIYSSGSIAVYRPRYEVFDYPYQTTDLDASGIITSELLAHQAPKQVATLTVRDNPAQPFSYQMGVKPGQIFVIDAPTLNTGSGMTFYYWRATSVQHIWDTHQGLETKIQAYPWMSGAAGLYAASGVNFIDYMLPVLDTPAVSRRSDYLPVPFAGYMP